MCHNLMFYNTKKTFTLFMFLFYFFFIVWKNNSSLYQISTFYNKSHLPNAIIFIKENREYFQSTFSNDFLSNFEFYKNIKSIVHLHYHLNDFTFVQKFTHFFVKNHPLSNIIRESKPTHQIYQHIFDPYKSNSKQTLSDIIQLKPLIQTKSKTDIQLYLSNNRNNQFNVNILFDKPRYSPEIIYCQKLHQISNIIANEFDQQPIDSKESFLSFMVLNLQKKGYSSSFFTFLPQFDTLRMIMTGYYPVNFIESLKIELISKLNTLLYLYKHSQNKMEYLIKQIMMESSFMMTLFINYAYFLFWAFTILCMCIIHIKQMIFHTNTNTNTNTNRIE